MNLCCRCDEKCISIVNPLEINSEENKEIDKSKCKEDDEKVKGDDDEAVVEDDARKITGYRSCKKPSKQMVDLHRITHMPYEPWCPDCVMGRGLGQRHAESAKRDDEMRVPTIAADYCFLGDDQEDKKLTVLVLRDSKSGGTCSTVVENKGGSCEWGVKRAISFIDGLGYGKVIFKSDNEFSVVDLWNAVRIARTAPTIPENCQKGISQANGIAERAIQDVEGIVRTIKAALERRIWIRIKASDNVMPLMIEHCSTLISRCRVGVDGMTAYERIKGKPNKKKCANSANSSCT